LIAVVLAGADPVPLRWALNGLEGQAMPRDRFEVVIGAGPDPAVRELVRSHPLAAAGVLRHAASEQGDSLAALLNGAWRVARAPLVVFAQPRSWPPPGWLQGCLDAAARNPGSVVQGTVWPDPEQWRAKLAPRCEALRIEPPDTLAGIVNSTWPVDVLRELGGFDARKPHFDADLMRRAAQRGLGPVAAPGARLLSSPLEASLGRSLRQAWGEPRGSLADPARAALLLAAAARLGGRRGVARLLLLAWLALSGGPPPARPGGWVRMAIRLPGRLLIDSTEAAALLRGALRGGTGRR
jgi:hypothetical protein